MDRSAFYTAIRPLFGGKLTQQQVDGLEVLLSAMVGLPITWTAYLLATAFHETAHSMQPLKETESAGVERSDAEVVSILDNAFRKGKLSWVKTPYWRFDGTGKAWFGRGYVQLTHKVNYEKAGKLVGVDLVKSPARAMNPTVAAKVLIEGARNGIFTGKKLADYLPGDYSGARRVINGTDRAALIAGYARRFEDALTVARWGEGDPPAPKKALAEQNGIVAFIKAIIAALGGKA